MKNLNNILFAAALAASFSLAGNASAQYKATGDDGITASPRARQIINERKAAATAYTATPAPATASATYRPIAANGIVASPKQLQQLNERRVLLGAPSTEVASVGYRATGADGITASPKFRQQLNESAPTFTIAPIK
jgi:hypothetical protein